MPRVRFTANYDHRVNAQATVAYKAGMELSVPTAHADAAIAKGKAVAVKPPPRAQEVKQEVKDASRRFA